MLEKNNKIDLEKFITTLISCDMFKTEKLEKNITTIEEEFTFYNQGLNNLNKEEKLERLDYLNMLSKIRQILKKILESQKNYIFQDNQYICSNLEIKTIMDNANNKYNLGLNIVADFKEEKQKLNMLCPTLTYHLIDDKTWGDYSLFVKPKDFEDQLKYLIENNYTPIFISQIKDIEKINKPIIITFDDGYKNIYEVVYPIIKKYNIKINVFSITSWINNDPYLTENMIKEMFESKLVKFYSHGLAHQDLTTLSKEQIIDDLTQSKKKIQNIINQDVIAYAYASGKCNEMILDIIRKYYEYAFITNKEISNKNSYTLNRINIYRHYDLKKFQDIINGDFYITK